MTIEENLRSAKTDTVSGFESSTNQGIVEREIDMKIVDRIQRRKKIQKCPKIIEKGLSEFSM